MALYLTLVIAVNTPKQRKVNIIDKVIVVVYDITGL